MIHYFSEKIAEYFYNSNVSERLIDLGLDDFRKYEILLLIKNNIHQFLSDIYNKRLKDGVYFKMQEYNKVILKDRYSTYDINEKFDHLKIIETNDPIILMDSIIDHKPLFDNLFSFVTLLTHMYYADFMIINGIKQIDENNVIDLNVVTPFYTIEKGYFILFTINTLKYICKTRSSQLYNYPKRLLSSILKYHIKNTRNITCNYYLRSFWVKIHYNPLYTYSSTYVTLSYNIDSFKIKNILEYDFPKYLEQKYNYHLYFRCLLCNKESKKIFDNKCINYAINNIDCPYNR